MKTGSRVLVQFGKKKYYTGIVKNTHSGFNSSHEIKPIMAVFDSEPIVRYPQLKFWDWISDYYLCSPGEVFKAAVPTGLKPESETFVSLNSDYEADLNQPFSPSEKEDNIIRVLLGEKKLTITEIENKTGEKNIAHSIKNLLQHDIIEINENVISQYRPKKIVVVKPAFERNDKATLQNALQSLSKSPKQEKALLAYLDMSDWFAPAKNLKEVKKSYLLKQAGVSDSVLRSLIDKGILRLEKKSINRFAPSGSFQSESAKINLTAEQKRVAGEIEKSFKEKDIHLLHGVTGSGKTEIYSSLIKKVLDNGNQVLFLVPEISLTTQLSDRLSKIFGDRLLIYHSKFSDSERVDIWNRLLSSNEPFVVLGVRSSIFLPFSRLGLIVVDEEHDPSYKQQDPAPRYNARDTAMMLARMHGAKTLLGSATPSVETFYRACEGKYGLSVLKERFEGAVLPDVKIIDMKEMRKKKEVTGIISSPLRKRILETLKENKQSIIFQNRRGFAPIVICEQCGWTPKCRNCDVSLIYHKNLNLLRCHYCGYASTLPKLCPACGMNGIKVFGYGTERIAEEMEEQFGGARLTRLDLDTTRNKNSYQEIIENFAQRKTDILIGTQMVTKGLDFDNVLTVGVVNADTLLNFPDFRSNERAFNMLEQVSGRAGRRKEMGEVIIQTVNPNHEVLKFVKNHDYESYYKNEIREREKFLYPPFFKIINIFIKNKDDIKAHRAAMEFSNELRKVFGNRVNGPEQPFVSRIALYYIRSIMIKMEAGVSMKKVKQLLRQIYASIASTPEMKSSIVYYDVDPV